MPDAKARHTVDETTGMSTRRFVLVVVLVFLGIGLLLTSYFYFGGQARGATISFLSAFLSEMTAASALAVGFLLIVYPASVRWPVRGEAWRRHLPMHLAAFLAFSGLTTFLMWAQRDLLWRVVRNAEYDFGNLSARIPMEVSIHAIIYFFLAGSVHAWTWWRELQERRFREARLEARLGRARLEALEARLRPHFLFNTLNAISSAMYREPEEADRLISRLSDLLRASLSSRGSEVSVAEEVELLERYLGIERVRFGERLSVRVEVDRDAESGSLPRLILQPLVENAIRHTVGARAGPGSVVVRIERRDGRLLVSVDDDGAGFDGDPDAVIGSGVGLANTRDRLRELYGGEGRLALRRSGLGGARVEITLPFREAGPEEDGP